MFSPQMSEALQMLGTVNPRDPKKYLDGLYTHLSENERAEVASVFLLQQPVTAEPAVATVADDRPHPAIAYLKSLFCDGDHIFFFLVHSTRKHPDKKGNLVADVKLLPLMPLKEAATDATMALLTQHENDGWNIFICMNPFPEGTATRTERFVKTIRNLFIESDGKEGNTLALLEDAVAKNIVPLPDSVLVSSPGKYHIRWGVEGIPPEEAKPLLESLTNLLGADPAAKDLHRVLRMPGFRNLKYPERPICTLLDEYECGDTFGRSHREDFKLETVLPAKSKSGEPIASEKLATIARILETNAEEAKFEMGAVSKYIGGYKWTFECPWVEQHTKGTTEGAILLLGDGSLQFNCFHEHCSKRGWSDIRNLWQERVGHAQTFSEPAPVISTAAYSTKKSEPEVNEYLGTPEKLAALERQIADAEEKEFLEKTAIVLPEMLSEDVGAKLFLAGVEGCTLAEFDRIIVVESKRKQGWLEQNRIQSALPGHAGVILFTAKQLNAATLREMLGFDAIRGLRREIQPTPLPAEIAYDDVRKMQLDTVLRQNLKRLQSEGSSPRIVLAKAVDELKRMETLDPLYPEGLTEKSLWGVLGDFVRIVLPTTEASAETLLFSLLPLVGSYLGKASFVRFGADLHYPTFLTLNVVNTSDGKGQAERASKHGMRLVDAPWVKLNVYGHQASGESLTRSCSKGPSDSLTKSVAIVSSEMAAIFAAQGRENSTLGMMLRKAYDLDLLDNPRSEKKNSPVADDYTIGFAGFITPAELTEVLPKTDWANGAVNRFLWNVSGKSKTLKRSGRTPDLTEWAERYKRVRAVSGGELVYSPQGQDLWDEWVDSRKDTGNAKFINACAREKANAFRLALLYAILDERVLSGWKPVLEPCHVQAAIEIVEHSRRSIAWFLFGPQGLGNANLDSGVQKLRRALSDKVTSGEQPTLTHTEVRDLLGHHTETEYRSSVCAEAGLIPSKINRNGRSAIVWKTS